MHAEMEARDIASSQLERLLRVSADFVEVGTYLWTVSSKKSTDLNWRSQLSYPYYDFKEKKIVALYHW